MNGTLIAVAIVAVIILVLLYANHTKAPYKNATKEHMNKIIEHPRDENGPMFMRLNHDDDYIYDDDLMENYHYANSSDVLQNILGDGIDNTGPGSIYGKYGGLAADKVSGISENKKKYNLFFNDFQNDILVDPLEAVDVTWTSNKMSGKDYDEQDLLNWTKPAGVQYLMNDDDMFNRDASVMAAGSKVYVDDNLLPTKDMTDAEWKSNLEHNTDNGPLAEDSFQYQAFYVGQPNRGFTDSNPQMQFNPRSVYEKQPEDVFLNTPKSLLPILENDSYKFPNQYVPNESLNLNEEDQYMMECAVANGCNRDYIDTFKCMNDYQHGNGLDRTLST